MLFSAHVSSVSLAQRTSATNGNHAKDALQLQSGFKDLQRFSGWVWIKYPRSKNLKTTQTNFFLRTWRWALSHSWFLDTPMSPSSLFHHGTSPKELEEFCPCHRLDHCKPAAAKQKKTSDYFPHLTTQHWFDGAGQNPDNLNQQLANTYISYKYYQIILSNIIKHSYNLCEQIKGTWSSELQIDELHEAWKHFDQPE